MNEQSKCPAAACDVVKRIWRHINEWEKITGLVESFPDSFSQELWRFSVFIVKAHFQQEPLTHGRGTLLKTKHFFYQLSFCFTHLFRWDGSLFFLSCRFESFRSVSFPPLHQPHCLDIKYSVVLFYGNWVRKEGRDGIVWWFESFIWFRVVIQGFYKTFNFRMLDIMVVLKGLIYFGKGVSAMISRYFSPL